MLALLAALRRRVATGFVGGSDLAKQQEQLGAPAGRGVRVEQLFDFAFSENGLTSFRLGAPLAQSSFIEWLGEARWQRFVRFVLH